MLHFHKTAVRKIIKEKAVSIISLAGLVLGISTFLFFVSWIRSEKSFDHFWDGYDRIYRISLTKKVNGSPVLNTAMNYGGVGPVLRNEFPEIETQTTFGKDVITAYTPENSFQDINFYYIDSTFFKVFPRSIVSESANIFSDIHGAMLSQTMARKLFDNQNPLNRKFKLNEGWEFYVCAVFEDFPENSHMKAEMMVQWKSLFYYMGNFNYETGVLNNNHISEIKASDPYSQGEWKNLYSYTYIKLKPETNRISAIESQYKKVIAPCIKHIHDAGEDLAFTFQPISDIHLHSRLSDEVSVNGNDFRIKAFGIIGILIILISWFNYINLSAAIQIKQAAKDQVKRIIGASKGQLFLQHFWETLLIHGVAGIVSFVAIVYLLKKGFHASGFSIYSLHYGWLLVICLFLVLTGTFLSSVYPILTIARIKATHVVKAVRSKPRLITSRQVLLIVQFSIAILLIISTGFVYKQIWSMQQQNLGIQLNQVMVSYSPMTMIKKPALRSKLKAFQDEVKKIPGVVSFTAAETVPGKNFRKTSANVYLEDSRENKYLFSLANIDQQYFNFFAIKILAGTNFLSTSDYDSNDVILNATACKRLGIANPQTAINRTVYVNKNPYRIVGVVDDYHHLSLKDEITPALFFKSLNWYFDIGYYCIKVQPGNLNATIRQVKETWSNIYPDEPYIYSFLDDSFNTLYREDENFGRTYLFFALIAIFIACMGLFALAKISAENKTKEIGIRKVNGARVTEILAMLNKDFIKWVIIAFIVACPLAWCTMHQWLQNFAYKTELSWWVFALAGAVAVVVAVLTVSWQSWRAATRNPVESLRYE
jgi:ABC-type antimicrobial peptide transport system, permease component